MKSIILVLLLFFIQAKGQGVRALYKETVDHGENIVTNHSALWIDGNLSYYTSDFLSIAQGTPKSADVSIEIALPRKKIPNEIYIDTDKKELIENKHEFRFIRKTFSIKEKLPEMQWKFHKGERVFNKIVCKKATTTFRGRTYTAWYTQEIPVSIGPWKFNGLPGLILYIEDDKKIYTWQLSQLQIPYTPKDIDIKKQFSQRKKYKEVSFKEFDQLFISAIKDKIEIVRLRNIGKREMRTGMSFSTDMEKEPQNEYRTETTFN